MTIQPQAKLPIDMAALLKSLGADVTGDFSQGSVSLNFVGTIMPLVGQMTITNPALGLIHEAEMVENDPGRTDIPQILEGLWWNISGGRDAQIMITNMSSLRASADVFLDYAGERHPSAVLNFNPHETKTVSIIQLLANLNATPSQAPEGGITIIQRELQATLIAQGKILDPVTGFSTTLTFPDPAVQRQRLACQWRAHRQPDPRFALCPHGIFCSARHSPQPARRATDRDGHNRVSSRGGLGLNRRASH